MTYPLVRDLAAEDIPVSVTCRVLGFSTQAFYARCARPCWDRDWNDVKLINAVMDAHCDDPAFGLPVHHRRAPQGRLVGV